MDTLTGLRPLLDQGTDPSAVAISSNSCSTMVDLPEALVQLCLDNNESGARELSTAQVRPTSG